MLVALLAAAVFLVRTAAQMLGPLLVALAVVFQTSPVAAGQLAAAIMQKPVETRPSSTSTASGLAQPMYMQLRPNLSLNPNASSAALTCRPLGTG